MQEQLVHVHDMQEEPVYSTVGLDLGIEELDDVIAPGKVDAGAFYGVLLAGAGVGIGLAALT